MYAIVQLGSNQYKVSEGDVIDALHLDKKEGAQMTLDKVLLLDDGKSVRVGRPYVKDAQVQGKVVRHTLGRKVASLKYRRRKDSATKRGHRQKLTALNITKVA